MWNVTPSSLWDWTKLKANIAKLVKPVLPVKYPCYY